MACIWKKCYCKVVFRAVFCFFGSHSFPYWSLLLGTNVPNDIYIYIYVCIYILIEQSVGGEKHYLPLCVYMWQLLKDLVTYFNNKTLLREWMEAIYSITNDETYPVYWESLEDLVNLPWFAKLKLVLSINNLLADLLICQTSPAKLSCYMVWNLEFE